MKKEIAVSKDILKTLGKRLSLIRDHLRLKQKELAAGLEFSESYICQIEKGNANPTLEFFYKLVEEYGVSLDYLFYGEGNMLFKVRKTSKGKDESMPKGVDTIDELVWYMEHSELFRYSIMHFAKSYLYMKKKLLMKDIEYEKEKKKKAQEKDGGQVAMNVGNFKPGEQQLEAQTKGIKGKKKRMKKEKVKKGRK